ncbi:transglycosylase SLT domain-containing protein [Nocardia wallacei]|uniref:transglycosylase SLT domain-containing protein n=1 Tax=Nocardia wallacei TaxID=480035 RepID=UPI0024538D87|nr:transglycosylase SLT domain-containing protein [Nocardia wallacei]
MHLRKLLPLTVLAAVVAAPLQAHAETPISGVPPELQGPAQQIQQQAVQPLPQPLPQLLPPIFSNDLDGWIRNALYVMGQHGIPGDYESIHRNIMRESGGNPAAINLYDSNAAAGIPSKGLMQVIDPTFAAFHVEGTSWDIFDPVANIAAACNYAANRYGSIANVFSAY